MSNEKDNASPKPNAVEEKPSSIASLLPALSILSLLIFWVFALQYIWQSRMNSSGWPLLAGSGWGILLLIMAGKNQVRGSAKICSILLICSGALAAFSFNALKVIARGFTH